MPEEDTEHYLLVRGDQLRGFIERPISKPDSTEGFLVSGNLAWSQAG
jgi:hypothetical protein